MRRLLIKTTEVSAYGYGITLYRPVIIFENGESFFEYWDYSLALYNSYSQQHIHRTAETGCDRHSVWTTRSICVMEGTEENTAYTIRISGYPMLSPVL